MAGNNGSRDPDEAIAQVSIAAERLADAKAREMELDGQKSLVKSEAIARIMGMVDPQKEGKRYSATAAAEIVESDKVYALHETDRRRATADTIRCAGAYEAAKLAALYAVNANAIVGFEPLQLSLDKAHEMSLR